MYLLEPPLLQQGAGAMPAGRAVAGVDALLAGVAVEAARAGAREAGARGAARAAVGARRPHAAVALRYYLTWCFL